MFRAQVPNIRHHTERGWPNSRVAAIGFASRGDPPTAILHVTRRAGGGLLVHHGVLVVDRRSCFSVYELLPRCGLRRTSVVDFGRGMPIYVRAATETWYQLAAAWKRLQIAYQLQRELWRYDPLECNCEHFARHILFGRRRSYQVDRVIFGALGGLVFLAAAREVVTHQALPREA